MSGSLATDPGAERVDTLSRYLWLYGALYAAYGAESAYLPAFFLSHGLAVQKIGLVLAAATLVRIASGPVIGRLADVWTRRREVLTGAALLSGVISPCYLWAYGLLPLLVVAMTHAAATASLAPLSDSLSTMAAEIKKFQYGWVRGAGSAAFVLGTLASGQLIGRFKLSSIIVLSGALFLVTAFASTKLRDSRSKISPKRPLGSAWRALLIVPAYRRLIYIAVLVIGSHAMNDIFAVIAWQGAGHSSGTISVLWSESVLSEVAVFFVLGPWLLARLGPANCAAASAAAGVLRWSIIGATSVMPALIFSQALHGLTFALLHLVAMRIIASSVPNHLTATAQTVYSCFALGVASATLTFFSGYLFGAFGLRAFWVMAALCALALPLTWSLEETAVRPTIRQR